MMILAIQWSLSRAMQYSFIFAPLLVFFIFVVISGIRLPGTKNRVLENIGKVEVSPVLKAMRWDVSLGLDSGFLQPICIAEFGISGVALTSFIVRLCRRLNGSEHWTYSAQLSSFAKGESILRTSLLGGEKLAFVHFGETGKGRGGAIKRAVAQAELEVASATADYVIDPFSFQLNENSDLLAAANRLSPSMLQILNGTSGAEILLKIEGQHNSRDVVKIFDQIAIVLSKY